MKINHINILPHHVIYQLELYITTCCPEKQSSTNYTVAFTYYNGIIDIKIDWISKYGGNTMKYQTSSKLIIIRAIYSIVMIAILAIIIGSQYLLKLSSEMHNIITYLAIILIVFLLILMLIYTPLEYKMLGIKINDSGVIIHRGLIVRKKIYIAWSKIYTVTKSNGPLELLTNTKSVSVVTLANEITIPAINKKQADEFIKCMNQAIKEHTNENTSY